MKQLIALVIVAFLLVSSFYAGRAASRAEYMELVIKNRDELIQQMVKQRQEYEAKRAKLEQMVKQSQQNLLSVQSRANNLRMQLDAEFAKRRTSMSSDSDRPTVTGKCDSGRARKMEALIKGATNLIEERDRIAEQYNQLRAQCSLN